jgi:hypothetical protein
MAREVRADGHLVDSCGITRLGVDTATAPRRVQKPVHAARRWYSLSSPPRRSRRCTRPCSLLVAVGPAGGFDGSSPPAAVAGLLGNPGALWVGGHASQVDSPSVQLDEEQHRQPPQPDRVDGEEIAGDDPGGLLAQQRPPGHSRPPRRRIRPVTTHEGADRGGRHLDVEVLQVALDALVAPARVLAGGGSRSRRGRSAVGASAAASWASRGSTTAGSRQCAADRRQQGSIGGLELRS